MRRLIAFVTIAAPASLAVIAAGCGGGGSGGGGGGRGVPAGVASNPSGARTTVATRHTALGTVLVNAQGRTLYLFEKDKAKTSTCDGSCAAVWPPLAAKGAPAAVDGVVRTELGTV